jgi:hypothetical protein
MDSDNERKKPHGFVFDRSKPLKLGVVCGDDDFTLFVGAERFRKRLRACIRRKELQKGSPLDPAVEHYIETNKTFDFEHELQISRLESRRVRIHAALCYERSFFSVTVRAKKLPGRHLRPGYNTWRSNGRDDQCPDPDLLNLSWKPDPAFAATIPQVALLLHRQLYPKETDLGRGLIIVAGRTASGKTQYLNALLFFYLRHILRQHSLTVASLPAGAAWPRRPHVLAIGDPVETAVFHEYVRAINKVPGQSCENAAAYQATEPKRVVDFTSRSIGDDVESVKDALKDALRETTSAVVVSELREIEDYKAALDFAATGHLIIATAHSGSLVDTMEKLIGVANVKTPSGRSGLVHRLQAIIHLEAVPLSVDDPKLTLPAMWRRNSAGVRNFVSEGLSSIQHRAPKDNVLEASTLGYYWAARELGFRARWLKDFSPRANRKALELDLAVR